MSNRRFHRASLYGTGLALALAASAFAAQPAPPANAPPRPLAPAPSAVPLPPPAGAYRAPPADAYGPANDPWRGYRQSYMEDYFTYLRNTLRITEAQRPLWARFENTVRQNMQDRDAMRPAPRDPRAGPPPLLDRLEQRRARLDAERMRLDAMAAALRPLYAAFSEEQRRIADSVLSAGRGLRMEMGPLTMRDRRRNRRPFGLL